MFCIVISTFCSVSTWRLAALTTPAPRAENGATGPPPRPPPGAATVRVPAALDRNSTTSGTCSSVRAAPFSCMRVTVVVHPSSSAVLFLTRSSVWHEAQAVFTRFVATSSGPAGAWARPTTAASGRTAATFTQSFRTDVIYTKLVTEGKRRQDLYSIFFETTDARTPESSRPFGPSNGLLAVPSLPGRRCADTTTLLPIPLVKITLIGSITNVTSPVCAGFYVNDGPGGTVAVPGVGTATFTDTTRKLAYQSAGRGSPTLRLAV